VLPDLSLEAQGRGCGPPDGEGTRFPRGAKLPQLIGLQLTSESGADETIPDNAEPMDGSQLRYAFMALLAVNLFILSGAACFAILYFFH
jgi:hypothetical protein